MRVVSSNSMQSDLRRSVAVWSIAGILVATSMGLSGIGSVASAQTGDPPSFQLPTDEALEADRSLVLVAEPAVPPDIIDVDPAIEAANASYDSLAEDQWDIEALVARLGGDAATAFSFVRDSIGFQPYPGVLAGCRQIA